MADNGATTENVGKVIEIKGVVLDAVFPERLPQIYTALRIDIAARENDEPRTLIAEVQQHLGDDRVRAVAMDTTDGLLAAPTSSTRVSRSRFRSARRHSGESGTCSASPSTTSRPLPRGPSAGRSTATRRSSRPVPDD